MLIGLKHLTSGKTDKNKLHFCRISEVNKHLSKIIRKYRKRAGLLQIHTKAAAIK